MPNRDPVTGALARYVASGSPEALDAVPDAALERLAAIAVVHRVPGTLATALAASGRPVPGQLRRAREAALVHHLQVLRALEDVTAALDGAGIRCAVLKGPVLAARWYRDPAARVHDDLDLLVAPDALPAAVDALVARGLVHRNRNWEGFERLGVGELPLDDGQVVVDLHWSLLGLGVDRRAFRLPTAELLDRAVDVELGGVRTRTLDDADTFVHLAVHHGLAGARHLLQLQDVRLVAAGLDPAHAAARIRAARAQQISVAVLDRADRVLGPTATGLTPRDLGRHRAWLALNRAVDGAWARRSPAGAGFPGLVVSAGRSTATEITRAVLGRSSQRIRERLGRPSITTTGGPLDWEHDAGGAPARARFLADVARGRYGL